MKIGRVIDALRRERHRLRSASEGREPAHVATYAEAVVYFTFVFGSTPCSPHAFAQRLLAAEIAETVSSPAADEVYVAPRYEQLVRLIRQAERVAETNRALAVAG